MKLSHEFIITMNFRCRSAFPFEEIAWSVEEIAFRRPRPVGPYDLLALHIAVEIWGSSFDPVPTSRVKELRHFYLKGGLATTLL